MISLYLKKGHPKKKKSGILKKEKTEKSQEKFETEKKRRPKIKT
jgi:hypothetical protein